ncbi:MAG: LysR family transcriptional regulator [Rhizobiaceae bacterium]|nr:LysR family transcriptional regulator [Rhizobiaceae bacterium]
MSNTMPNGRSRNLRALQTFEAVARHRSVTRASHELGVTQSAISHQLRNLAEDIGEKLFTRSGRNIVLTEAGERLGHALHAAFHQIDRSVDDAVGSNRKILRLAVCSSFAPGWLIGRLSTFVHAHPDIDLQLRMYAKDPELTDQVADAFVTTLPKENGFWSLPLRTELLVAVVSPELLPFKEGRPALITTNLEPERVGKDWSKFCDFANIALDRFGPSRWLQTSHYVLALEMARARLGAALVPDFLVEKDLNAGTLVLLSSKAYPTSEDYYLCMKSSRRTEPGLNKVAKWFSRQIA